MPLRAGTLAGRRAWVVRILILVAFALLLAAVVGVQRASSSASEADRLVAHTLEVRREIERFKGALADMETAQRGYLLIPRPLFVQQFGDAKSELAALQASLRRVTADNASQQRRLDQVEFLTARRVAVSTAIMDKTIAGDRPAAMRLAATGQGSSLMVAIRAELAAMDSEEARLFGERQEHVASVRRALLVGVGFALMLCLVIGGVIFYFAGKYVHKLEDTTVALRAEILAREQSEAQLRQAQKMEALGQLTGGIAHDFNNMLQIVTGSLQLLSRRLNEADPQITKYVSSALEGANRAAALTKRLLAFSRQQALEPRSTDVNRLVSNLAVMLERTVGGGVHVETVLAGGLWPTFIDPPQLESAIVNLAVNARDAMHGDGKITIETANTFLDQRYASLHEDVAPGQYVMVAVTDTGAGMSPDIIDKAFDPFFTTKERGSGTGLGLSQVHGFIKQSGGHVKIYSEPGVGTTVKLYLPRHFGAVAGETPNAVMPSEEIKSAVLLVEDDADVRAFVSEALQELGCRVVTASGGAEALQKLSAETDISLMLTDVVMPEMSGRVLADQALAARPGLKVIFMTGFTQNAIVHNGVVDPGTRLLSKPFTLAQLEMELKAALAEEA